MARMKSAQAVYYGPADSGYPSVGRVSANESVDFLWTEGAWCYIRYSVSGTANKKCGYVPETAVNHANESPLIYNDNNSGDRYIRAGGTTYTGPGSSGYVSAGSVDAGELVAYTGYKYNDYALIEYSVGSTSNKKRAWYSAGDMTREPSPGLVVGQRPSDMNINSSHYTTSNMYYPDYVGECTWFCWGRAHEKCGKSIQFTGSNNGGEWYDNCNYSASGTRKIPANQGPVTNSICSCGGATGNGHVIFVERVDGNTVYYTEANVGGTDGVVKSCSKSNFPPNRTVMGYIGL